MYDIAVIGGGIVGLATAWALSEEGRRVVVLEKEGDVALHQSGRNSGVLHSGIYYKPGSLKAQLCREGRAAMAAFCREEELPFRTCGKVIVATDDAEGAALEGLLARGRANGVACELVGPERLRELEPYAQGVRAIHVPDAAVVDFAAVCRRLAEKLRARGSEVVLNAKVTGVRGSFVLETTAGAFATRRLVNCAGLFSDRVARLAGAHPPARIIPFRGEYYALRDSAAHLCRALIYPVPDPRFPFLGVHFTRGVHDDVECGPNAVISLARPDSLLTRRFARLAARYWRDGLAELARSLSKRAFLRAAQRLVPAVTEDDLTPAPAGVRAQAVAADGALVDDFALVIEERAVHVINAPSPAATAAFAIGRWVAAGSSRA